MNKIIVTGCNGLVGSSVTKFFDQLGWHIIGIDNNYRENFFGHEGNTLPTLKYLQARVKNFEHYDIDIRDRKNIFQIWQNTRPDAIVHCAAQPSHDLASKIPFEDFEINAVGTQNLLEATRLTVPQAPFVFLSTNKVYGDNPNRIPLVELPTRWEYAREQDFHGVDESCSLDKCMHSLFGVSKLAADVMVQEYAHYFGMKTTCLRAGCITGPQHAGVKLHGFLSYLVKSALQSVPYTIYGYKGKQVRDQIHADDLAQAIYACIQNPHPGAVYNIGGGRRCNGSVLECIDLVGQAASRPIQYTYHDEARKGDHICYISDTRQFQKDHPTWQPQYTLDQMIDEIIRQSSAQTE